MSPKTLRTLKIIYVIALLIGAFYVKTVVSEKAVEVSKKPEKDKVEEIHPAKVNLIVNNMGKITAYEAHLRNTDTVLELFEHLRVTNGFYFEKTAYSYGTTIDNVNRVKATGAHLWEVYKDGKIITFDIHKISLEDNATYEIKLIEDPTRTLMPR